MVMNLLVTTRILEQGVEFGIGGRKQLLPGTLKGSAAARILSRWFNLRGESAPILTLRY